MEKISHETPLVQAMLDKEKGDSFDFTLPNGKTVSHKIIKIK